ncbi:hypothetical protein FSARC_5286 [Fusarium sarcochroum]|uniref:Protein kinase domain-containing protein n=1 Tax=Fusarium sarcochroum TaxID=1208366 RepID=A0A8H4TZR4_9HYPO|nr:hypothetical protein FSARC_5286 [Fusarium sarcochroum]
MYFSPATLPFKIAEDNTAHPISPGGPYESIETVEDSVAGSSLADSPSCLVSKLAELRLDSSSSISRARIVTVANENGGVMMKGDGKPIDSPSGGLSIEQVKDKPDFTISSDEITIKGYYLPGKDDIIVYSCGKTGLEVAEYSSAAGEMTSPRTLKTPLALGVGLWQISESARLQFCLNIFPRTCFLQLTSKPTKRPRSEDEEGTAHRRKKIHFTQIQHKSSDARAPDVNDGAGETGSLTDASTAVMSKLSSSFSGSGCHATLSGEASTHVFTSQRTQYGLVSIKVVGHPTKDSIQQLAQRWCRESSAARRIQHPFLTQVMSVDARSLSLCLDGLPVLLCNKDDENYFTGTSNEGIRLCIQIASALVFLHSTIRQPHLAVNSRSIFKKGSLFTLSGFGMAEDAAGSNIPLEEMECYATPGHVFGKRAALLELSDSRHNSCVDGKKNVSAWQLSWLMPQRLRRIEHIRQTKRARAADPSMSILLRGLDPDPQKRCSSRGLLELALHEFKENAEAILKASVAEATVGTIA